MEEWRPWCSRRPGARQTYYRGTKATGGSFAKGPRRWPPGFGYERIDTPVFEDARLFVRGVGEVTDIVEKETYTFEDRGGDLLTLRPEGTAPVCRAYLEHGMHNLPQPVRLYYMFPGFRYERPQSGRYRQHHQFGVELLGDADASADAEVIEVGWRFLESIGLRELSLGVNSIGDAQCRPRYVEELKAYYRPHVDTLCTDCRRRLEDNPLRLLDCKRDSCQPVVVDAPRSIGLPLRRVREPLVQPDHVSRASGAALRGEPPVGQGLRLLYPAPSLR